MDIASTSMIDPRIFESLKAKAEEETKVSEELGVKAKALDRDISFAQGLLTRIHSTPKAKLPALLVQVEDAIKAEIASVQELAVFASQYPYYKYNHRWTRNMQNVVSTMILCGWLGGMKTTATAAAEAAGGRQEELHIGRLMTIEEVGEVLNVPVNVKDRDTFHLTIEEYLIGLMDTIEELSRLAMNSVTLGDMDVSVKISAFVKDIYAGFQLLNLKNDIVRRKFDGMKYHVKKVEDVIYDLSLRNLISKE
ncbi:hypothetical protein MKZ38_008558 [Zalerion maritima]|uniref:Translin n=1 Tax=Zalerion maritima TaxID=339359 RepID=A0AAD5RU69_9PEZI|nr:hypothetical protein MKZ38_008558 [Zalerion maritima]